MTKGEIAFNFNRVKTIEAILYIAQRIKEPDYHAISKLLYFADKTSLERYGRFITGDTYYAMQYGPVPSHTYDLLKNVEPSLDFQVEQAGKRVVPIREPNLDEMSESDVEVLDLIIDLYGEMPFWMKTQISHDEAWQQAWDERHDSQTAPMSIESIVALLKDADILLEFLRAPFPGEAT